MDGVELVDAVGRLSDAANHHPHVDLRDASVTVRLMADEADVATWMGRD